MGKLELSVCVSNALSFKELKTIVRDLQQKKLTFGVYKHNYQHCVLWRSPIEGDRIRPLRGSNGNGRKDCVISKRHPDISAFHWVWVDGKIVRRNGIQVG